MEIASDYALAMGATGAMAILLLIQLIIADVVGIRARHVPGSPVPADHSDALFRVTRTVANANESIAIFILAIVFCVFSGASPLYTGYAAVAFVLARALYAVCYYFNVQLLRSVMFGISLVALAVMIGVGLMT